MKTRFNRLPLPLAHPERVVLITRKDPQHLSRAWDAGIVSVVSVDDAPSTVLLAIMAAALRIPKAQAAPGSASGISPSRPSLLRQYPQKSIIQVRNAVNPTENTPSGGMDSGVQYQSATQKGRLESILPGRHYGPLSRGTGIHRPGTKFATFAPPEPRTGNAASNNLRPAPCFGCSRR